MTAEKFFKATDPLVREVWWSLAYGKSSDDQDVVKKLEEVLSRAATDAVDLNLPVFYDLSSEAYPDVKNETLDAILADRKKFIPYLAAQLKDLFVEDHKEAEKKDGNYI